MTLLTYIKSYCLEGFTVTAMFVCIVSKSQRHFPYFKIPFTLTQAKNCEYAFSYTFDTILVELHCVLRSTQDRK